MFLLLFMLPRAKILFGLLGLPPAGTPGSTPACRTQHMPAPILSLHAHAFAVQGRSLLPTAASFRALPDISELAFAIICKQGDLFPTPDISFQTLTNTFFLRS
jgi:hypothetical protein